MSRWHVLTPESEATECEKGNLRCRLPRGGRLMTRAGPQLRAQLENIEKVPFIN